MAEGLFHEGELRNALEGHAQGMEKEISEAPEEHLMQVEEDEWVAALVERYEVHVPERHRDQWWMDAPEEIQVDVRYDGGMRAITDYSRPALINGFRIVVHVPFTGERDIFKFTPSTRNYNPPRATVTGNEVQVVVEYPADAPRNVRAEAEAVLNSVRDIPRVGSKRCGDLQPNA